MIDASLVVIGSRARRGVGGHLMGLLPEAFVRQVHRPVLVVRGQSAAWPPSTVIIAETDGADDAAVAQEGATLARVLKIPATSWVTTGELAGVLLGLASDPRVLVGVGKGTQPHRVGRVVSALLHQAAGPVLIVPGGVSAHVEHRVVDLFSSRSDAR